MTHFEMLKRIKSERKGVRLVGWVSVHHKTDDYCWNVYPGGEMDNACALASGKTPEAAIEAAFKKLFPPIPQSVGEGKDAWEWTQDNCHDKFSWCCKRGKFHSVEWVRAVFVTTDTYMFHQANSDTPVPISVSKQAHKNFLKLIDGNPDLKPPTEE